ncbi:uncharacterized protein [Syngnathus scovelli]|nr:uncharacterized protein LOC125987048 isoform X2 [Syngnathus scovelli]XP_049607094.1 uncharacterized protein LOC125987048 isoform X2 [Syngnathus scovelli]XP_049607095.1 uncharacterized protein LOC125987048 isoform X2 [Syngnathus scovelli]
MKTSKGLQSKPALEECGVWLDTVELKGRPKQKKSAWPISKMLNPLAKGAGHCLAVVFNFTQTKIEMPKTKQSSISSYFPPRNKSVLASGGKCESKTDVEMRKDNAHKEKNHNIHCEIQGEQSFEMEEDIQCKVREEEPHEIDSSQESSIPLPQTLTDFDLSKDEKAFRMEAKSKTSTQNPLQLAHSSHDDEKENRLFTESFSPPRKRAKQRDDEDSLASMFTQDSDGFRVIAHRAQRSPFQKRNGNDGMNV